MRTLTLHTADDLAVRWKRKAFELGERAMSYPQHRIGRHLAALDREAAQAYRVCATELDAIVAVSMELEAAHHGDPEPELETETVSPNALLDWSQGNRP
jgi:hypothetical protein